MVMTCDQRSDEANLRDGVSGGCSTRAMAMLAVIAAFGCYQSSAEFTDGDHDTHASPDDARADVPDDRAMPDIGPDADADAPDVEARLCPTELGGPCNVVTQCGCAPGERCVLSLAPSTPLEECVPAGTDLAGAQCEFEDHCAPQNQCRWNSPMDYLCMQFCYDDEDCPAGLGCDYDLPDIPGYRLCGLLGDGCDPLTGAGCPPGEGCILFGMIPEPRCEVAGLAEPGRPCPSFGEICRVGAACYLLDVDGDTSAVDDPALCYEFCDLEGIAHPCPAGFACSNTFAHPEIGICTPG